MIRTVTRNGKPEREFRVDTDVRIGYEFCYTPVVIVPKNQLRPGDVLWAYAFHWDDDNYAMPLGTPVFANHSDRPNTEVIRVVAPDGVSSYLGFRALRDIAPGEEITHKYKEVWFDDHNKK